MSGLAPHIATREADRVTDRMSNDHDHETTVSTDSTLRLASAACSCGWSKITSFARSTGEPVAYRLAALHADRHAFGLDGTREVA